MPEHDIYIDGAPIDIYLSAAQGPALGGGGSSDVGDLTTTGLTAGNMLRVKSGGGLEERTPTQVLGDISAVPASRTVAGKALSGNITIDSADLSDATADNTASKVVKRAPDGRITIGLLQIASGAFVGQDGPGAPLTGNRSYYMPDASGVRALTQSATGVPDALSAGTISGATTVATGATWTYADATAKTSHRTGMDAAKSGANTDLISITSSTALTLASASGQSILINAGGTNRATVSLVGITLADNHYLRANGATGETAHFRFGAANTDNGLAQVVRNSDSAKVLQFGSVALNLMGGYDLVGRSTAPALDVATSGEVYRLASSTGNITTSGSIATTSAVILGSFTVGTVPGVSTFARGLIYVSNESGGATVAYSNGTNWKRVYDNANIS